MKGLQDLPEIITAIGGLGTAAFGLVDATKVLGGGVNHVGFGRIRTAVEKLTPQSTGELSATVLPQEKILATLKANWFNGTDIASQKAIAKSLIKLNLSAANATALASETGVDRNVLGQVASSIATGTPLTTQQSDVFARFDLIVTTLLDEAYQRSDQAYRNGTRALAMAFAIVLAMVGGFLLHKAGSQFSLTHDLADAAVVGLLATPLAPIAKDLSTALATAVDTLQRVRK
jgi:hypothetical protein